MLETMVLGLLYEGPLTGYDLKKRIENGPGVFVKVSYGNLYPLLGRLCEKGHATVAAEMEGGRVKKYYSLTAAGKKCFEAWLRAPVDVKEADSLRLAKIYFFDRLPEADRRERLAEYRQGIKRYLEELQQRRENLLSYTNSGQHYFKLATLYYGICVLRETLRWCKCLEQGRSLEDLLKTDTEEASIC